MEETSIYGAYTLIEETHLFNTSITFGSRLVGSEITTYNLQHDIYNFIYLKVDYKFTGKTQLTILQSKLITHVPYISSRVM